MNELVYPFELFDIVSSVEGLDAVAVESVSDDVEVGRGAIDNLVVKLWVS